MGGRNDRISRRNVLKHGALATGALVLGGAAVTGTAAAGSGDGRVGHYTLNNLHYNVDKGTRSLDHVHDASPEKNHGKWLGDEDDPVVAGWVGNAFVFDGNDYIDIPFGDGSEIIYPNWTVSGWINPANWGSSARKEWLSVAEDRTDDRPLDFVHEDGQIKHYRGQAAGEVMAYDVSGESGWHHMLVTQERTGSTAVDVAMYFDGVQVATVSGDYENMRPSTRLHIGRLARVDSPHYYWDGLVDEVRLYNRVLSSAEITELAEMGDE